MPESKVFAAECSGKVDGQNCTRQFTFDHKPERDLELKCPHCGTIKKITPATIKEVK